MQSVTRAIFVLSILLNGALAGLIAGHLASDHAHCGCRDCDCGKRREARDEGPFPTGWVSPDAVPAKPDKPSKPTGAIR